MDAKESVATIGAVGFIVLMIAGGIGWIWNIFKVFGLVGSQFSDVWLEATLRIFGILFAPLVQFWVGSEL